MPSNLQKKKKNKGDSIDALEKELDKEIDEMVKRMDNFNMHKIMKHLHDQDKLSDILDELGINLGDKASVLDTSAIPCGKCNEMVDSDTDGVSCHICDNWYHFGECSKIDKKNKTLIENPNIWFVCDTCKEYDISQQRRCTKKIENKLDTLLMNSEVMADVLQANAEATRSVVNNLGEVECKINEVDKTVSGKKLTYAETLKTKNALIIKCADESQKAADKKKEIMASITTPVDEVKETNKGHLFVRFGDKSHIEKAKDEIKTNKDLLATEKGKLKPKIKIVYVPKDDEEILDSLKIKNTWLESLINDEDDLKLIKEINTKDDDLSKHCIIKCSPQIRKAINERNDVLYTMYKKCKIFDYYMPYQCFKCQEFGHSATRCNKNQVCPKCSDNHRPSECTNTTRKCSNCVRKGHTHTDHRAFDQHKCEVYKEEISKARNNTDHGFD